MSIVTLATISLCIIIPLSFATSDWISQTGMRIKRCGTEDKFSVDKTGDRRPVKIKRLKSSSDPRHNWTKFTNPSDAKYENFAMFGIEHQSSHTLYFMKVIDGNVQLGKAQPPASNVSITDNRLFQIVRSSRDNIDRLRHVTTKLYLKSKKSSRRVIADNTNQEDAICIKMLYPSK